MEVNWGLKRTHSMGNIFAWKWVGFFVFFFKKTTSYNFYLNCFISHWTDKEEERIFHFLCKFGWRERIIFPRVLIWVWLVASSLIWTVLVLSLFTVKVREPITSHTCLCWIRRGKRQLYLKSTFHPRTCYPLQTYNL